MPVQALSSRHAIFARQPARCGVLDDAEMTAEHFISRAMQLHETYAGPRFFPPSS
jgi:hypothetical protein